MILPLSLPSLYADIPADWRLFYDTKAKIEASPLVWPLRFDYPRQADNQLRQEMRNAFCSNSS